VSLRGGMLYACREPGCLVRYDSSHGYFIDTRDAETIKQETTPRVSCPNDGQLMYLAEVIPKEATSACGNARNVTGVALTRRLWAGSKKRWRVSSTFLSDC